MAAEALILARLNRLLVRTGLQLAPPVARPDLDPAFLPLHARCAPYTMTSIERMYALWDAVRYVVGAQVPGDVVECGVWRGGSSMLAALTLLELGDSERDLHLFDTYEGMTEPTARDDAHAHAEWASQQRPDGANEWCLAGLDEVRANMAATGYPAERIRFVEGRVEDTIPASAPERIALLRLDTDWYESTKHELEHLYPRLDARRRADRRRLRVLEGRARGGGRVLRGAARAGAPDARRLHRPRRDQAALVGDERLAHDAAEVDDERRAGRDLAVVHRRVRGDDHRDVGAVERRRRAACRCRPKRGQLRHVRVVVDDVGAERRAAAR